MIWDFSFIEVLVIEIFVKSAYYLPDHMRLSMNDHPSDGFYHLHGEPDR